MNPKVSDMNFGDNFQKRILNNENNLLQKSLNIQQSKEKEENIDLGNIEKLKKYLVPNHLQSTSMNIMKRHGTISTSPPLSYNYKEELENEEKKENEKKPDHKMRQLFSQKIAYNKPKTTNNSGSVNYN